MRCENCRRGDFQWVSLIFIAACVSTTAANDKPLPREVSVEHYDSIQAAIDANPGRRVYVPQGDYVIKQPIRLKENRSGLFGDGRIVQENSDQPIVEIQKGADIELRGLTLTRPEGKNETNKEGVIAIECDNLVVERVTVIDNRSRSAAISIHQCRNVRISHCLVQNYMRITIEDRTADPNWGYAFHCIDGTGIQVNRSTGTLIECNRVIEQHLRPTPEIKKEYHLGDWVKKNPQKGNLMTQQAWDLDYSNNWQQGSAIVVTAPEVTDLTRVLGNHIENAAQGIDLHSDHVVVANNIVVNSFMGMKAMHGSQNVLITGNQFIKSSIWAIGLMPGVASHTNNRDGGSIIANNIISDFGYGDANWIWGNDNSPLRFDHGQEPDDPPLTDVIVTGNVIHTTANRRYRYAVRIEGEPNAPQGIHFASNILPPGSGGMSNVELQP
jgi:hypothetical protein